MKNKTKRIIIIATVVIVAVAVVAIYVISKKSDATPTSKEATIITESTEKSDEIETTTVSETTTKLDETTSKAETTKKNNPNKTCDAPNQYKILGDVSNNKIIWNDDNSLRIYKYFGGVETSNDYYDIKINSYGEVQSIFHTYEVTDGDGNCETVTKEHYEYFKYNSKHQLTQIIQKDYENKEVEYTYNYYYNSDGQRIKSICDYYGEKSNTAYEYENGLLIKSTLYDFYPDSGGDKICAYKYDTNSSSLVTKAYMAIENPDMNDGSSGDNWEEYQSYTYEKVTKAQYNFFYNTLIYHIIDGNERLL